MGNPYTGLIVRRKMRRLLTVRTPSPEPGSPRSDSNLPVADYANNVGSSHLTNEQPLVTVIIPSYNHERFIREAIYSVANQTYKNIELIIIDDGSTDSSPGLIEGVLREITSLKAMFLIQENRGAHNAINSGIALANGEYIAILNSDDVYYPHRIERLLISAVQRGCLFIFSKVDHIASDGTYLNNSTPTRSAYLSAFEAGKKLPSIGCLLIKCNIAISTSNFFMHKFVIEKVGLFNDYKAIHDWDYLLRVLLETEPCMLDESLVAYRVHEHNTLPTLVHLGKEEENRMFRSYANAITAGNVRNRLAPRRI